MRDFKNMKRQRGRNRGGGGNSGGGRPQQNANRAFDSNGPDNVKIRGHAQHVFEKYQQLARDAFSSGDRVLAENYLQHADHYFRLLRTIQPHRPASEILGRDNIASGLDIDFEEEIETPPPEEAAIAEGGEAQGGGFEPRQDGGRYEREGRQDRYENRGEGQGGWRDRQDNRPDGRQDNRPDTRQPYDRQDRGQQQPYGERQDRNRPYNDRGDRGYGERPEGDRPVERQDRYEGRRDNRRFDNSRRDERPYPREPRQDEFRRDNRVESFADQPQPTIPEDFGAPSAPAVEAPDAGRVLRSEDGAMSEAPAFLQSAPAEGGEDARPRVRRRRAPRTFQGGEGETDAAAPAAGSDDQA